MSCCVFAKKVYAESESDPLKPMPIFCACVSGPECANVRWKESKLIVKSQLIQARYHCVSMYPHIKCHNEMLLPSHDQHNMPYHSTDKPILVRLHGPIPFDCYAKANSIYLIVSTLKMQHGKIVTSEVLGCNININFVVDNAEIGRNSMQTDLPDKIHFPFAIIS